MKLSLIIPCYNEEKNISLFYNEVLKTFKDKKISLELIFINDGSSDNTIDELIKISKKKDFTIKIIDFSRNFGKEAGMYAGFKHATGDYICVIDADLQQPPALVLKMLNILEENEKYDVVAAYQTKRQDPFLKKHLSNAFYKVINKLTEIEFKSGASDFRLFRKSVVSSILDIKEYYRFSKGIFSWIGYNTYYMEYEPAPRASGTTKWSLKKLFKYAFNGILSYTTFPIKIATVVGGVLSFLSFVYLLITIIQKLFFGIAVEGYASLLGVSLLLGGIQLLFLGIIGEYIARIYIETKERPIYIAKRVISNEETK